jgi:hypothetical protein
VGGASANSLPDEQADRPPPTPPHHAQGRVEGGEITVHGFAISQRVAPEVCYQHSALSVRGRREAGRPMRPIAACAGVVGRTHTR